MVTVVNNVAIDMEYIYLFILVFLVSLGKQLVVELFDCIVFLLLIF